MPRGGVPICNVLPPLTHGAKCQKRVQLVGYGTEGKGRVTEDLAEQFGRKEDLNWRDRCRNGEMMSIEEKCMRAEMIVCLGHRLQATWRVTKGTRHERRVLHACYCVVHPCDERFVHYPRQTRLRTSSDRGLMFPLRVVSHSTKAFTLGQLVNSWTWGLLRLEECDG